MLNTTNSYTGTHYYSLITYSEHLFNGYTTRLGCLGRIQKILVCGFQKSWRCKKILVSAKILVYIFWFGFWSAVDSVSWAEVVSLLTVVNSVCWTTVISLLAGLLWIQSIGLTRFRFWLLQILSVGLLWFRFWATADSVCWAAVVSLLGWCGISSTSLFLLILGLKRKLR